MTTPITIVQYPYPILLVNKVTVYEFASIEEAVQSNPEYAFEHVVSTIHTQVQLLCLITNHRVVAINNDGLPLEGYTDKHEVELPSNWHLYELRTAWSVMEYKLGSDAGRELASYQSSSEAMDDLHNLEQICGDPDVEYAIKQRVYPVFN